MRYPITPRNTLLRELRSQLRDRNPRGRVIVAVDGFANTKEFADEFAKIIGEDGSTVLRASIQDFSREPSARVGDTCAPQWIDEDDFRRVLIDPYRLGSMDGGTTGFQLQIWDREIEAPVQAKWTTAGVDAVLVIDGPFLLSPALRGLWHYATWLRIDESALAERDGRSLEQPFTAPELAYLADKPWNAAAALVEATDLELPQQFFQDFC